ncbi:hypothetical protein LTSEUGA_5472, partial [Salmonella enterica subsp. enterica serovar Uganda str. R8-3404]
MSDGTLTAHRLAQVPIKLRYNANKKRPRKKQVH